MSAATRESSEGPRACVPPRWAVSDRSSHLKPPVSTAVQAQEGPLDASPQLRKSRLRVHGPCPHLLTDPGCISNGNQCVERPLFIRKKPVPVLEMITISNELLTMAAFECKLVGWLGVSQQN